MMEYNTSSEKTIDEERQGEVYLHEQPSNPNAKKLFLESYGCAMNFSDSEVVASLLISNGFSTTQSEDEADLVLINTCAVRDNAEQRVRKRLTEFKKRKQAKPWLVVGVLGCMAERLKNQLLEEEKLVDLVVGPDAYRSLPELVEQVSGGQKAVNVLLSREETYADINPVRLDKNGVTAFVSITRGCDNMCSFCVVPFTRGRERSRDWRSIVEEVHDLARQGYKEVTLLGQNVDSYQWNLTKKGEIENPADETVNFAQLLEKVALAEPLMRIRFSTSHPKDLCDEVAQMMAKHTNICKHIHLPVQSGSSSVLERMNRGYSREWYIERAASIRRICPEISLTTDFIVGFCGETEEEHKETLTLMDEIQFDFAYMYKYSERPKTLAERKFKDDVPEEIKQRRLEEIIEKQHSCGRKSNQNDIGKTLEVLIEYSSKKSENDWSGRTSQNKVVNFPKGNFKKKDTVNIKITSCTQATLVGEAINEA